MERRLEAEEGQAMRDASERHQKSILAREKAD